MFFNAVYFILLCSDGIYAQGVVSLLLSHMNLSRILEQACKGYACYPLSPKFILLGLVLKPIATSRFLKKPRYGWTVEHTPFG